MRGIKNNKGFTLIELLVVISIISTLSSIIFTLTSGTRLKSRDTLRLAQIREVEKALDYYYDLHESYPGTPFTVVHHIPLKWQQLMITLNSENLLKVNFTANFPSESETKLTFIKKAYAQIVYYISSIQDPLYISSQGVNVVSSYAYTPTNWSNGLYYGYILRVKLEDLNHKILQSSGSGILFPLDPDGACDITLGYYCIVK